MNDYTPTEKDIARFWSKVDCSGGPDSCWIWTAGRSGGYGTFRFPGETKAHRVAWILTSGKIPGGLHVLHSCDNPPCCNPNHLRCGTHADNMSDMAAKKRSRSPRGEGVSIAKLTEADIPVIRRLYAEDGLSQQAIADRYGVSQEAISCVVRRDTWKHVG